MIKRTKPTSKNDHYSARTGLSNTEKWMAAQAAERSSKMDKETMDKINEVLKANGRQELSMDELDKVVGGGLKLIGYDIKTLDDVDAFVYTLIPAYEAFMTKDEICAALYSSLASDPLVNSYRLSGKDGLHNYLGLLFDKGGNGF